MNRANPDPDEWVRVPVGTRMPKGTRYRSEDKVAGIHGWSPHDTQAIFVKRSDLDAILKPAPTPAEKLAEALTQLVIGAEDAWLPDDVQSALDAAGLTLAERGEK